MLALMIVAAIVQAPPSPYAECLRENLPVLEASREPAPDVARATFAACIIQQPRVTPELEPVLAEIRESMREEMVLHVVRIRACRNTAGCRIADLPDPFGPRGG